MAKEEEEERRKKRRMKEEKKEEEEEEEEEEKEKERRKRRKRRGEGERGGGGRGEHTPLVRCSLVFQLQSHTEQTLSVTIATNLETMDTQTHTHTHTHLIHFHTRSKVHQLEMSSGIQQHVIRLHISMDISESMYSVHS